jgi:hypothetical protein
VCNRNPQDIARLRHRGESGAAIFDSDADVLANEMEGPVADERSRQQVRLAKNLEAVADAEHELAALGFFDDRSHDRGKPSDSAAAKVVAIRKPSRKYDQVVSGDRGFFVPDVIDRNAELAEGEVAILITIGTWETDNGGFHSE